MLKSLLCTLVAVLCFTTSVQADVSTFIFAEGGVPWADVVILPEGPAIAHQTGAEVILRTPVRVVWRQAIPEPALYLNAALCRGEVRAVGQGNATGQALEIRQGAVRAFGPSFGQNATALACVNNRFLAYTQFSPTQYAVSDLDTMTTEIRDMALTSQGFREVLDTGEIRLADDWFRFPNQYGHGWSIHQPVECGGVFVGQDSTGVGLLALMPDRAFHILPRRPGEPSNAFEPKCGLFPGGFAVASRTDLGAALAIVTPPYPPHEPVTIEPKPEICGNGVDDDGDTLVDENPPCPPPIEPQFPTLPAHVCQSVRAERARFGAITSTEQITEILNRTAWAHRGEGWGLSTKRGGTRCPSPGAATGTEIACDILHRKQDNLIWDVLGAAGVGEPTSAPDCNHPPEALGPMTDSARPWAPPSDPGGVIDPNPGGDVEALKKRIMELERQVAELIEAGAHKDQEIHALRGTIDELNREVSRQAAEIERLKNLPPPTCQVTGPGWVRNAFRIRCEIVPR